MADFYWYISADKIRMLKDAKARSAWEKLSLTLKLKFLEVETGVTFNPSLVRDLKAVEKQLRRERTIVPFQELKPGGEGAVFSFAGEAARLLTAEALWIATANSKAALLLVGAPRNAAGQSQLKEGYMSPSLDPVGAVKAAAPREERQTIIAALSFAWQQVMRDATASGAHFPRVEGLAVFAGAFEAHKPYMAAANHPTIERIVLGSPIYVRQAG